MRYAMCRDNVALKEHRQRKVIEAEETEINML